MKARLIMEPPIGIILTMGAVVIEANGGLLPFVRHFESCLRDENSGLWLQKSRMAPKEDIALVYIVLCNVIRYKVYYGGYRKEYDHMVWMRNGERRLFPWPHMMLSGPIEKAPRKIPMRGFQGFRYIYEPIF